jgi:DNA-binding transcriptional LysR family regulator
MFKKNINLNLYKVFYDVCKYGSFSKTAEFTYTTQSAISKSIKKLEEDLETQLFYRNSNGIELTNEGRELFKYVEESYANLLTAERVILETQNLERGTLNIGLPSHIASFFFFDKIIDFHNKYPNIEIKLISGSTHQLLELIDKHEIDLIIDTAPINTSNMDLTVIDLFEVKYAFICNKEQYDKYKHIKSIKDLEEIPLIIPPKGTSNRKKLDQLFIKYNVTPKKIINIHTSEVILNAVNHDLGIGYLISDIVKKDKNYKYINIKEELPTTNIVFAYNKKFLTSAPIRFIEEYMNFEIK